MSKNNFYIFDDAVAVDTTIFQVKFGTENDISVRNLISDVTETEV